MRRKLLKTTLAKRTGQADGNAIASIWDQINIYRGPKVFLRQAQKVQRELKYERKITQSPGACSQAAALRPTPDPRFFYNRFTKS
jgi:hypothetical protein